MPSFVQKLQNDLKTDQWATGERYSKRFKFKMRLWRIAYFAIAPIPSGSDYSN